MSPNSDIPTISGLGFGGQGLSDSRLGRRWISCGSSTTFRRSGSFGFTASPYDISGLILYSFGTQLCNAIRVFKATACLRAVRMFSRILPYLGLEASWITWAMNPNCMVRFWCTEYEMKIWRSRPYGTRLRTVLLFVRAPTGTPGRG